MNLLNTCFLHYHYCINIRKILFGNLSTIDAGLLNLNENEIPLKFFFIVSAIVM